LNDEFRRAGEQTSPQVARAAGLSRKRDVMGGLISGSRSIRLFPFKIKHFMGVSGRSDGTVGLSFRGEFNQKVDGKGRMSIPADFRAVLGGGDPRCPENPLPRMVVLHGPHLKNCLHAYTIEAMEEIEAGIKALPRGSDARKRASRMILGKSWDTEVDKDGRIVLPQRLRQQIGLTGEATMAAMGDYFEIWNSETYAEVEAAEVAAMEEEFDGDFDPLSLIYPAGGA